MRLHGNASEASSEPLFCFLSPSSFSSTNFNQLNHLGLILHSDGVEMHSSPKGDFVFLSFTKYLLNGT
jgi:hypothetical protein